MAKPPLTIVWGASVVAVVLFMFFIFEADKRNNSTAWLVDKNRATRSVQENVTTTTQPVVGAKQVEVVTNFKPDWDNVKRGDIVQINENLTKEDHINAFNSFSFNYDTEGGRYNDLALFDGKVLVAIGSRGALVINPDVRKSIYVYEQGVPPSNDMELNWYGAWNALRKDGKVHLYFTSAGECGGCVSYSPTVMVLDPKTLNMSYRTISKDSTPHIFERGVPYRAAIDLWEEQMAYVRLDENNKETLWYYDFDTDTAKESENNFLAEGQTFLDFCGGIGPCIAKHPGSGELTLSWWKRGLGVLPILISERTESF